MVKRISYYLFFFLFFSALLVCLYGITILSAFLTVGSVFVPLFLAQESTIAVMDTYKSFFVKSSLNKGVVIGITMFVFFFFLFVLVYRFVAIDLLHLM